MTDISNWPDLVQVVKLRSGNPMYGRIWESADGTITKDKDSGREWNNWRDAEGNETPIFGEYVTIPMNEYVMGNVLGMLKRAEDTGDWYYELISMIYVAMNKAGLKELQSNHGDTFTIEQVWKGDLEDE